MPRAVTIGNVGQAFEVVKAMQTDRLAFGDDHRPLARARSPAPRRAGTDRRPRDGGACAQPSAAIDDIDFNPGWRRLATYVDRILKGAPPASFRSNMWPTTAWSSIANR